MLWFWLAMPSPGPRDRAARAPGLLISGHEIALREGETIIGRGDAAHISVSAGLVSRRHVRLMNRDGRVSAEDLQSRNGVFVNGERLVGSVLLEDGDTLLVGTTELTFFMGASEAPTSGHVAFDEQGTLIPEGPATKDVTTTLIRMEAPNAAHMLTLDREDVTIQGSAPPPARRSAMPAPPSSAPAVPQTLPAARRSGALPKIATVAKVALQAQKEPTLELDTPTKIAQRTPSAPPGPGPALDEPLVTAVAVARRMLSRGDVDAAGRTLAAQLGRRLQTVHQGHPLDKAVLETTALFCCALYAETGEAAWFDRAIEMHLLTRSVARESVIEQLAEALKSVPLDSRELLLRYQILVRELLGEVDAIELDAADRILTLAT
jgi:hypothetical protein